MTERRDADRSIQWLRESLPGHLPAFLMGQRWFGGKARGVETATVADLVPLGKADAATLVVAHVAYLDGSFERYGLLVGLTDAPGDRPRIGPVNREGLPAWAVEVTGDRDCLNRLLAGFAGAGDLATARGGSLLYRDATDAATHAVTSRARVTPVGSEQSNTSIRVGDALVFKLFRRLPSGENPEVEMGRFLTARTTFRATPALHGSLTYVDAGGHPSTLGVLQAWVHGARDGWEYVLDRLEDPGASRELAEAMAALGATTAGFHASLASDEETPAFRPETVGPVDLDRWTSGFRAQAQRSTDLVRRHHAGWSGEARSLGETFLGLARDLPQAAAALTLDDAAGLLKIRVHGDYHLGQTLRTADGFAIIDFEGEPSRPLDERRQKLCALKDVAGMLRSFDYAVETVRRRHRSAAPGPGAAAGLRGAFLGGYLDAVRRDGVACVPRERAIVEAWLTFFELDKALYELEYEINNRPAWVDIPLGWIVRGFSGRPGRRP